jgi:hypothetical protein
MRSLYLAGVTEICHGTISCQDKIIRSYSVRRLLTGFASEAWMAR